MKKQNQIRKKSKAGIKSAQHEALREKRSRSRVPVLMPAPLARAIRAKSKKKDVTVSQLAQTAIEQELSQAPEIPENWEEVAFIDFTGYLDRDTEERIIYKTPEGTLKARRSSESEPIVIEDVTREQVVQWLHECVIPEEFEADFRRQVTNPNNGSNRPTPPKSAFLSIGARLDATIEARDRLDDATLRSSALLEALAALLEFSENSDHPKLSDSAAEGLKFLAFQEGVNLRERFGNYTDLLGKGRAET